jgi:hypothetical protein
MYRFQRIEETHEVDLLALLEDDWLYFVIVLLNRDLQLKYECSLSLLPRLVVVLHFVLAGMDFD